MGGNDIIGVAGMGSAYGGSGNDNITGQGRLDGGDGRDVIVLVGGGFEASTIFGGDGDDTILGEPNIYSTTTVYGGRGDDRYDFMSMAHLRIVEAADGGTDTLLGHSLAR
jgi:Ca2+-binding RTX toxin-like protein